jgi:hypothetical protein
MPRLNRLEALTSRSHSNPWSPILSSRGETACAPSVSIAFRVPVPGDLAATVTWT